MLSNNRTCQIKVSHSIHMLNIQIASTSVEQSQIVLLFKPYETELFITYVILDAVWLLDTQ